MALQLDKYYEIQNVQYGTVMNLYGTFTGTTIPNATQVSLWSRTGSIDQQFMVQAYAGAARIVSRRNAGYAVNRHSGNGNAIMWPAASASVADTEIDFLTVNRDLNLYRLRLNHHNLYLTATGANGILAFRSATNADNQLFKLLEPGSGGGGGTTGQVSTPSFTGCLVSEAGDGRCLNVYGNDTIEDHRDVCLYEWSGTNAQKWNLASYNGGQKIFSQLQYSTFALNVMRTTNNCDVFSHAGNDDDSLISLISVPGKASTYYVTLSRGERQGYALTAGGNSNLATVTWAPYVSGNKMQQWLFTTTKPATPSVGTSVFTGHLVSDAGAGRALNVYGNETISDSRNVCLYSWGDNNAQTWKLASYNGDMKLFSGLNYPTFALNVYRADNNCTVLSHIGNDDDSHIYRTAVTGKPDVYTVRLKSGERAGYALTADGNYDLCNVSWQPYSAGNTKQEWLFTTEPPTPSVDPGVGAVLYDGYHIVSHAGAGYTMNISGNEQVSNNRNVNVWEWSTPETHAQKWKMVEYNGNRKILSTLSYPTYGLNIFRDGTNNCDVYPHAGNDGDSTVYTTPVAGKSHTYYIRMAGGPGQGLALTVDDGGSFFVGANISWKPYVGSTAQQWLFTKTQMGPAAPPPTEFRPDSTLVNYAIKASRFATANRTPAAIREITIHHMAAVWSVQQLGNYWQNPGRDVSSHYGVSGAGIGQYVMEKDIAWTNGHSSNNRAVTIEVGNSATGGDWPVSELTFSTLVRLVADIARRNNLGTLVMGGNLTWHSMYQATACPGNYLRSRMAELASRANAINSGGGTEPPPVDPPPVNPPPVDSDYVEIPMDVNLSQKYENYDNYDEWFISTGCAVCCGIDIASWLHGKEYTKEEFESYYNHNSGYSWDGPENFHMTIRYLTQDDEATTLQIIRDYIDQGKPVAIFGLKEAYYEDGEEKWKGHWMVAYKYKKNGGDTFRDSGIEVLDPANVYDVGSKEGLRSSLWDAMKLSSCYHAIPMLRHL